jgi:hypothetical protein
VFADLSRLPPLLLQAASDEMLLDDSRRVHDKVRSAGGISRLEVFDGVFHAWHMLDGFVPEARIALQQAGAFVNDPECSPGAESPGDSDRCARRTGARSDRPHVDALQGGGLASRILQ